MTKAALATSADASVEARFPGAILGREISGGELTWTLSPAHLIEVCEFLRDESEPRYDLLITLTRVGSQVHYQLASSSHGRRLRLRVPLAGQDPTDQQPAIDSLAFVWPAANWAEREAHDLWGVVFQGHPRLQPLFGGPDSAPSVPTAPSRGALLTAGTRYPTSVEAFFLQLSLDGDQVTEVDPELGYRHIGLEKRLVEWPYERGTLLMARIDGFSAMHGDLAYALAVEKLLGVEPPCRAQQLRLTCAELQRVASHLFWLIRLVQNLSDPVLAVPTYAWEGRTAILDLFQWLGGNPITPDVIAVGGLKQDAPPAFESRVHSLLDDLEALLDDLDHLLTDNASFRSRLDGAGVLDPGTALGLGVTGPCLRASGIGYDVRKVFPYAGYRTLDVQVPVDRAGDAGARYQVRMAEMRVSLHLIREAVSRLADGPVNAFERNGVTSSPPPLPAGIAYASVEGARGELGVYLVSDGCRAGSVPCLQCAHVRAPSFANLSALPYLTRGRTLDQVTTILDSLDISMGEVER